MTTVRKILDEKAESRILTIPSNATVFAALQVMCEGNTGAVLVTEDEKIVVSSQSVITRVRAK